MPSTQNSASQESLKQSVTQAQEFSLIPTCTQDSDIR